MKSIADANVESECGRKALLTLMLKASIDERHRFARVLKEQVSSCFNVP